MTTIVLTGHATMAPGMRDAAEMIFGRLPNFHAVSFLPDEGYDGLVAKLDQKLVEVGADPEATLVLADLFGGTPYNAASTLVMQHKATDVVAGLSLPMVLEIAGRRKKDDSITDLVAVLLRNNHLYTRALSAELAKHNETEEDF